MIIPYAESQKSRLVDEVRLLSLELGRPVSSRDLLLRWKEFPERRPLLTQCVGQLLIKASRPVKRNNPTLLQFGLIGNLAFYATTDSPRCRTAFRHHEIDVRARIHARWSIPEHAVYLLETEHESLARNALSGFTAEWEPIAADKSIVLPDRIHDLLEIAHKEAPGVFSGNCPNLIGRAEATDILRAKMRSRDPLFCESANINRYLSRLAWPMTPLFTERGFWEFQLRQYVLAKWPLSDSDPLTDMASFLVAIYGTL